MCTKQRSRELVIFLFLVTLSTAACATSSPQTSVSPSPTHAIISTSTQTLTPTSIPPTATRIPNTATPSPIPSATPVQATSAKEILGLWHGEGRDGMQFKFEEDGTCQQTQIRDSLDNNPNVTCEYKFEGDQLIFTTLEVRGLPPCEEDIGIYEVHLLENGNIKFMVVEDSCRPRVSSTAVEHVPIDQILQRSKCFRIQQAKGQFIYLNRSISSITIFMLFEQL